MSNELIVFTHNDLDALGCMLNIEYRWPSVIKKYFHTNYANIDEITDEIIKYGQKNGLSHVLIADVSFGDNKPALTRLYEHFDHVTHIDHHLYSDGFWDDYPNMKVVWDKSKSATKLCNEYLGNTGKNPGLDKLSFIIDIYDLWQTKSEFFDISQDLNNYFWVNVPDRILTPLLQKIIDSGWKLPNDYLQTMHDLHEDRDRTVEDYEKRQLIQRADDITIAFVQDWFNHILIEEMKKGQNFVIGANPYGIIRIRIREDSPYSTEQKNALRIELTGTETIGHMNAFTYKMKADTSFDNLIKEVQRVSEAIQKTCK